MWAATVAARITWSEPRRLCPPETDVQDRPLPLLFGALTLGAALTFAHSGLRAHDASPRLAASAGLVRDLG